MTRSEKRNPAANAVAECLAEVRRHDRERYLTAMQSPLAARRHLLALYAFNLELSQVAVLVNDRMLGLIRLQWWRDTLAAVEAGEPAPNAVVELLGMALNAGAIEQKALLAMVDGRERDLDNAPFADRAALRRYISGTAGALLRSSAVVAGASAEDELLDHLGFAYGVAGIIRAVPFHARSGRLCLPADLLQAHGLSGEDVLAGRSGGKLGVALADLAATGMDALRAAEAATAKNVGLPALLHGELAKRHLRAITKSSYDPYDPPPSGSGLAVLRLKWRGWRGRL